MIDVFSTIEPQACLITTLNRYSRGDKAYASAQRSTQRRVAAGPETGGNGAEIGTEPAGGDPQT